MSVPLDSRPVRLAAALLLAAPAVAAAVLLGIDMRAPPTHLLRGETPSAPTPLGTLKPGDRHVIALPSTEAPLQALVLLPATYNTRPTATFELCVRERCEKAERTIKDNAPLHLPLPAGSRGGEVTLTVHAIRDGSLAYWGHQGQPLTQVAVEPGWTRPLTRARGYFAAFGVDLFWPLLGLNALALLAVLGLALWRGLQDEQNVAPPETPAP